MIDEKNLMNRLGTIVFGIDSSFFSVLEPDQSIIREENIVILEKFNKTVMVNNILDDKGLAKLIDDEYSIDSALLDRLSDSVKIGGNEMIARDLESFFRDISRRRLD